jgi:hypothetical protein
MTDDSEPPAGWSARAIVGLGAAALAAAFAFAFLWGERQGVDLTAGIWAFALGTLAGHAAGGLVLGWALAGLFGRRGVAGWALAAVGGALVTVLGGLIGTAVEVLPAALGGASPASALVRVAAGALITPLAIASAPWLGAVWAGAVAALHLAARAARRRA